MAAVAKGVALSFGLVTASVSVHNAIEKVKSSNVLVCANGHDPIQIRMPRVCETWREVAYADIRKAAPVEGGLVLLDAEDVTNARSDAEVFKQRATITPHQGRQALP